LQDEAVMSGTQDDAVVDIGHASHEFAVALDRDPQHLGGIALPPVAG
jgi:hypothetical protein